ncbi:unnamed protein product, partial [Meganyctiphanes norvegica]
MEENDSDSDSDSPTLKIAEGVQNEDIEVNVVDIKRTCQFTKETSDTDTSTMRFAEGFRNKYIEEDVDIRRDCQFTGEPSDIDLEEAIMISHIAHYPLLWLESSRTLKNSAKRLQDAEDCINDINAELLQKGSSKNIIADKKTLLSLLNKFTKKWEHEEILRKKYYNEIRYEYSAVPGYTPQWYNFHKFYVIARGISQETHLSSDIADIPIERENMEECNSSNNDQKTCELQAQLSASYLRQRSHIDSQIESNGLSSCLENIRKRPYKDNSKLNQKKRKKERDVVQMDTTQINVNGITGQSSEIEQEPMRHLLHEPVCHIKEEPIGDPIENYIGNTKGQMDW